MPVGSFHGLEGPEGQEGLALEGLWDLCRLADSLTFIRCPFFHSVLATMNQMDKLMENRASEENTLLISSKIRQNFFSLLKHWGRFCVHEFKADHSFLEPDGNP